MKSRARKRTLDKFNKIDLVCNFSLHCKLNNIDLTRFLGYFLASHYYQIQYIYFSFLIPNLSLLGNFNKLYLACNISLHCKLSKFDLACNISSLNNFNEVDLPCIFLLLVNSNILTENSDVGFV